MRYTSQELIEAQLKRRLTGDEIVMLPFVAETAESFIEDQTETTFGDVAATQRYYDGGTSYISIDPCRDITYVKLVDSEETSLYSYDIDADLEVRPRNDTIKTWIEKRVGCFPYGVANIEVTAKFTSSPTTKVPSDIQYLATYLCSLMYKQLLTGELKRESIEGYSREWRDIIVADDQVVKTVLEKYTKNEVLI